MILRPPEKVNLFGTDTGSRDCLSHSRLGTFLSCQQKFEHSYVARLEPAVKKPSLMMGAAFASALELNDPQAGYDLVMDEQAALAVEHGGNPWVVVPDREEALTQATIVRAASRAYLTHYGWTEVEREVSLRARIRNPMTGAYSRTFDVMARVDGLSGSTLVEDKFVGKVEGATERKLKLDRQVTLGAYLLWRCRGIDVETVSYRMTKKPSIKQRQNDTLNDYLERVEWDYEQRPEFYLHEFPLTRTPEDFLRLEQELWVWCEQIRSAEREGTFPRNTNACLDYGGCQFLPLCSREPGALSQFVERPDTSGFVSESTEREAA